jgi:hypothetical protein
MKKIAQISIILVALLLSFSTFAQKVGTIQGVVKDKNTQELLVGVTVQVDGTTTGSVTDVEGKYKITGLAVGSYNVKASFVGYKTETKFNVVLTTGNASFVNFELNEDVSALEGVEIVANKSVNVANMITPLSVQSLTVEEIRSNPGGNFDVSRVIQALPGVAGSTGGGGFRNDIIIRGGAPNENVYYLDGIEVPVINHFQTQGASGGPQGILNTAFIEDVKLSSSAFDARFDNALASVLEFKQRDGNPDKFQGNFRLSGTEVALAGETPIGKKTTALFSIRRSYLQLLFEAIDLPIRPNYWDSQFKITHKLNSKTTITALGIGAIDEFKFGVPKKSTPDKEYSIRSVPLVQQTNYTLGLSVKRLIKNGYMNFSLSRNEFNNDLDQFEDGKVGVESLRTLGVVSKEVENKLRIEYNKTVKGWKYSFGVMGQALQFDNKVFTQIRKELKDDNGNIVQPAVKIDFNSNINFLRYGAFGQVAKSFINNRLGVSFGLRTDLNNFTNSGNNPLETLSPRGAVSYALSGKWNISASIGSYHKIPIYTVLGFKDNQGNFANKDAKYIQSTHYVTGLEFIPRNDWRITVEGFYKTYSNVPLSVRDGISLANQGTNFGAIGNEAVTSNGRGRAYGFEVFLQKKLQNGIFATLSYTYVLSEFTNRNGEFAPSAWDSRHLFSGILGRKFKRGWEMGLKYRFAGGVPYTPFDLISSQRNYVATGQGVLDYTQINTQRIEAFNQFDFRIDKKWNFKKFTFDLYMDIINAFVVRNPQFPRYTFARNADNSGFATTDGQALKADGSNAKPTILSTGDPVVVPTIGFIVEF